MYTPNTPSRTTLKVNNSYKGETIEQKVNRIVNNKEPIKDGAPLIYTERREGTQPMYDIRTDRFELAVDAMDKITKDRLAQRDKRQTEKSMGEMAKEYVTKTDSSTVMNQIVARFDRIEEKIDRLMER